MSRKPKSWEATQHIHEFTKQIHSSMRNKLDAPIKDNWDEKKAKNEKRVCCHDCLYFQGGCSQFIGKYHKPCEEFQWW